ncbi:hypothetical protein P7C73_g6346, partial [Tremellales sp. Uapishka_1]
MVLFFTSKGVVTRSKVIQTNVIAGLGGLHDVLQTRTSSNTVCPRTYGSMSSAQLRSTLKLSSAHVYLRQPDAQPHGEWDSMPAALINDAAQLVKANSIEGNKKDNITIIYTPWSNLKKSGDMAVGQVSFHNDKKVKRCMFPSLSYPVYQAPLTRLLPVHVPARDNAIVNRLNKTKVEKVVDHESERQDRLREEGKRKKIIATELRLQEEEQKKAWEQDKKNRTYEGMYTEEAFQEREDQSDDDFM